MYSKISPAAVAPELLATFFQSAATILLRPLPAPGQPDQSSSGVNGTYLVIKRLLPFFEQSAPAEMVESLRGHLNALNSVISDNTRRRDDESISRGIKPEKPAAEREQALLDRIDRAKTSAERDSLYIQLAFMASNKGEVRARDFVNKVEDPELRKQAQAFIDASLVALQVAALTRCHALDRNDRLHVMSFAGTPKNRERLLSSGFVLTGKRMPGTRLEIVERQVPMGASGTSLIEVSLLRHLSWLCPSSPASG
jgi:hypothetical protein